MPTILNSISLRYIKVSFSSVKTRWVEIDTSRILGVLYTPVFYVDKSVTELFRAHNL